MRPGLVPGRFRLWGPMDFTRIEKQLSTATFCALFFAQAHLTPLDGEDNDLRAIYLNKAVKAGIIFG